MNEEVERIYTRLSEMDIEINNLRQGYVIVNQRYTASLESLKELAGFATLAAKCSQQAAVHALLATRKSVQAAQVAASQLVIVAAEAAADAAADAAQAATEAAASAAAASSAAASAAAQQAEQISLQAAAEAAVASRLAATSAAEAVKLAQEASKALRQPMG